MTDAWNTEWQDYYEILQINPKADPIVIAGVYNKLAKKYHPDLGGDKVTMQLLNEAYSVLSDPAK
ncbi:MAG: J domain-containing protein [Alphaproteobacteria bacterium]|nr:J domain-containing protein [Alphaproteobacteria bacterium]